MYKHATYIDAPRLIESDLLANSSILLGAKQSKDNDTYDKKENKNT